MQNSIYVKFIHYEILNFDDFISFLLFVIMSSSEFPMEAKMISKFMQRNYSPRFIIILEEYPLIIALRSYH